MTQRTLVKGAEAALPVNVGTASTFSGATVVRLVNTSAFVAVLTKRTTVAPENVDAVPTLTGSAASAPFTRVL